MQPEEIVEAATALIEDRGLDGFSMRALADVMGVQPMTFYHHFADRDALLDAVVDAALRAVEVPRIDGTAWDTWVIAFGQSLRRAWSTRARLVGVLLTRPGEGAAAAELVDTFLTTLVDVGFTPARAHHAWHAVLNLVVGDLQQRQVWGPQPRRDPRAPERRVGSKPARAALTPVLAACDPATEFRVGLRLLVAGLSSDDATPA